MMAETIRGKITKVYHSGARFSAGLLQADDGKQVRFAGALCANVDDVVALVGRWKHDAKYGRQFAVESVAYDLPESLDGHAHRERPIDCSGSIEQLNSGQRAALRAALWHPITLICGAAGTGKTFVLARIARAFWAAGQVVALCAPTGKAAKRMEETLRSQGLNLEARTIHRLLHYDGARFKRPSLSRPYEIEVEDGDSVTEPACDVVIVDEVSMVDVPLMAALLQRIDFKRTRLVLVGDHNQLPPVGPGNVLRDLIAHQLVPTVILETVERQAGVLKANSTAVLDGVVAPTAINDPGWTIVNGFQDVLPIQSYLRDLVLKTLPERLRLDPVRDIQIITPTHLGALGTKAINQMMQHALHGDPGRKFAIGDKVIQTANDYELGVMNGTQGRVEAYCMRNPQCRTLRNAEMRRVEPERFRTTAQRHYAKYAQTNRDRDMVRRRLRGVEPPRRGPRHPHWAGGRVVFCCVCGQCAGWRSPSQLRRRKYFLCKEHGRESWKWNLVEHQYQPQHAVPGMPEARSDR